jgi:enterochelin esterase-like enzyme
MQPNSKVLVIALFVAAAASVYLIIRFSNVFVRIGAGALTIVLAMTGGMAIVNDYYGYYQSWGQLGADLTGSYSQFTTTALGARTSPRLTGKVVSLDLTGARSGINRGGYVYLPPQYFQRKYAHTRLPVVELLHGSPSYAASWLVHLHTAEVANQLLSKHLMGPMVLVMPQTYTGNAYTESLNSSRGSDETYLTTDVRHDVETRFRVARDSAQWGLVGVSSGGYCAANLALRHPASYGAVGILSGYFRPQDGPAAQVLGYNQAAEDADDPLLSARRLSAGAAPLPAFWLAAGTGDRADYAGAQAFAAALRGVERVTLYKEPGGQHNFYAFAPAFNRVLPWVWTQLAAPQLRVQFPIAGPVTQHSVSVAPTQRVGPRNPFLLHARERTHSPHTAGNQSSYSERAHRGLISRTGGPP